MTTILNIIAIIIIIIAVYVGELRYKPGKANAIYWVLIAVAVMIIAISGIIAQA